MLCGVCNSSSGIYKCPACVTPYCSVPCFKNHKNGSCVSTTSNGDSRSSSDPKQETVERKFETDDTVPEEKLKLLDTCDELKDLLGNPHLKNLLKVLDSSQNPTKDFENAMGEPLFTEFVDVCMKVVDSAKKDCNL